MFDGCYEFYILILMMVLGYGGVVMRNFCYIFFRYFGMVKLVIINERVRSFLEIELFEGFGLNILSEDKLLFL